jgi:hypothetical protein
MKLWLTRSFVGNKVTIEWPSRTGSNNHCPIICAECALAVVVTELGDIRHTKKKGLGLSEK